MNNDINQHDNNNINIVADILNKQERNILI